MSDRAVRARRKIMALARELEQDGDPRATQLRWLAAKLKGGADPTGLRAADPSPEWARVSTTLHMLSGEAFNACYIALAEDLEWLSGAIGPSSLVEAFSRPAATAQ